jgi:5'-nucleotidase
VNFPVLAANLDSRDDPDLSQASNLKPFVIYAFDGNQKSPVTDLAHLPADKQLVAVIGLVLEDMANISPTLASCALPTKWPRPRPRSTCCGQGINRIMALTHRQPGIWRWRPR